MNAKSAVVSVLVVAGVVGFNFGGEQGLLSVGGSRVFAADAGAPSALPAGLKGFMGIVSGTLVAKTETGLTVKVAKIEKLWPNNKAEAPENAVGQTLSLRVSPQQKPMRERLATVNVGDEVAVGAAQREGDSLNAVEVLVPAADLPALLEKWAAAAKERQAREALQKQPGATEKRD